jgi:hypothetical protein
MFIYMIFKDDEVNPLIVVSDKQAVNKFIKNSPSSKGHLIIVKMLLDSHRDVFREITKA